MSSNAQTSVSMVDSLVAESERFKNNFVRVVSLAMAAIALIALPLCFAGQNRIAGVTACMLGLAVSGASYALARSGHTTTASRLFLYGVAVAVLSRAINPPRIYSTSLDAIVFIGLVVNAAFLLRRADSLAIAGLGIGLVTLIVVRDVPMAALREGGAVGPVLAVLFMVLVEQATALFVRQSRIMQERLQAHVTDIDRVMTRAQRIAAGDLSGDVEGDSQVSQTIRSMLESLRDTVLKTRESANGLAAATQEIAAMARQQESGAVEQAAAVNEIRATLDALLDASNLVAQNSQDVFRSVEQSQGTSDKIAERIATLSGHTRRITAILDIIKGIANKSEILALNASLEGARAGEAGRGFSLVASQMQRLAESVMDSIKDVRTLTDDIETATNSTVVATEEGTKLAVRATGAARQISVTAQQQRSSTEQVSAAMQDIGEVAKQVSAGSTQTLSATRDLTRLAEGLQQSIQSFRL